ncbi:MAG TPA: hypothetical protein VFO84_08865 [Dehalococcoidia bacterium]|nr:hypothetical protein [Dehalococcoidia bacterium]
MKERVLYVASWLASPAGCEAVPASRYALTQLRSQFEVEVFNWPFMIDGPGGPPSWEGAVQALRERMTEPCHVITMETATPAVLMALGVDGGSQLPVQSLCAAGIAFSPATLRSLGMGALATAAEAGSLFSGSYQWVRHVMQGGTEEDWRKYANLLDGGIDWPQAMEFRKSYDKLDLLKEKPQVHIPALYMDKPPGKSTFGAAIRAEVFERFVPSCEKVDLRAEWGNQLQDASTGRDISNHTIPFIQRHSTVAVD